MAKLSGTLTPEGFVIRRTWPTGEDAWRKNFDRSWAVCHGHKGPWVSKNAIFVPADVLRVCADAMERENDGVLVRGALLGVTRHPWGGQFD